MTRHTVRDGDEISSWKAINLGLFTPVKRGVKFFSIFNEEIRKVHGPIQTQFGYHLIEIISRSE